MAAQMATILPPPIGAGDPQRDDELLTTEQLAGELNVPASRLHKGRISGDDLPPYMKLGHLVRYRRGDVRAWIESRRRFQSTSEMEAA